MKKMLMSSMAMLALALPGCASNAQSPAPTASAASSPAVDAPLQDAKHALAMHDMPTAAMAIDHAMAMMQNDPKMAGMEAELADAKKMVMAGDGPGAAAAVDKVIMESHSVGSRG